MNMKNIAILAAVMVVGVATVSAPVALAAEASAKADASLKVAIFDAPQVINGTNAAKRAVSTLTSRRDAAQKKINALEKPLLEKQQKLREQQTVMAPDKFQAAQESFAKDLADFRAKAADIQGGLDEENMKLRKQIAEAVRDTVEKIAKERGYDLVLPKGMTFYAASNVPDISAEVLEKANKALDK
jgi:Skp family chaperone for outer membrane proteins